MKIAVMGTGGVGGYFGGQLAAAGLDVHFIARGAHLAALRAHGLQILSPGGDQLVRPVQAGDDPSEIGPVDVVLFATKLWDVESAGDLCGPLLGPDTAVISLLNGIDSEERLIPILGLGHVVGGVAYISAGIAEPGVIQHFAISPAIAFGELDGRRSARLDAFDEAARAAGLDARYSDEIERLIWDKFVFLAAMAGVTALSRQALGPIRQDPDLRWLLGAAIDEVLAVARAKGVACGVERGQLMQMVDGMAPGAKASMLMDLEKGNRLEVAWLSGAVARLGDSLGVPTPVHRTIFAALKPFAAGRG